MAVTKEQLIETAKPAVAKAAQQQVLILGIAQLRVVGIVAKPVRASTPGRMRERKANEGTRDNLAMVDAARHLADQFPATRENQGAAADQVELRIFPQAGDLPKQPLRKADIIRIHPRRVLTLNIEPGQAGLQTRDLGAVV